MAPPRRSEEDIPPELGAALSSIANALAAMQQNQQRLEESVRRNEFALLPPPPKRGDIKSFLKFNPRQFDVLINHLMLMIGCVRCRGYWRLLMFLSKNG